MPEVAQKFGGAWSLLKVELVEKYLRAFNVVLREKPSPARPFRRVYIDTFAGSGSFTFEEEMPLLPAPEAERMHAGSAKRAMAVLPGFDELYFFELDPGKIASLKAVVGDDPRVSIIQGDANTEVPSLLRRLNWKERRGVIFVDPCGPESNWDMIRAIAATQALDMFWLFPISAVYRNAPRDHAALTQEKRRMCERCLDGGDWEKELYSAAHATTPDLFAAQPAKLRRHLDIPDIEAYVTKLLISSKFAHVEKPGPLYGTKGAQLFSLYFAVSNPSGPAIRAASSIARDLLDKLSE
jgi:three-Cys-motif partner protein